MSNFLGFNPRDLEVFQAPQQVNEQPLVYKVDPEATISEDGIYRSQIRILYNVRDMRHSIVEKETYALRDADGFFKVDSPLSVNDRNCPLFKTWKKLRYSGDTNLEAFANEIFQKIFYRWCLIQVIDDPNKPEYNGKYMFFRLPKFLWDIIQSKMNPAPETKKAPVPVMDFMRGTVIYLNVSPGPDDKAHPERKKREIKYSTSEVSSEILPVTREDGTLFLTDEEQAVVDKYIAAEAAALKKRKVEERDAALAELAKDPLTQQVSALYEKVAEELKKICPDLCGEMAFHYWNEQTKEPWDPQTTARVNAFCELAAKGIDPARQTVTVNETAQPASVQAPVQEPLKDEDVPSDTELDDLPF